MHSNLSCQQPKTDCQLFYISLVVNTKQKPRVDTQTIKASMHTTTDNHQIIKEQDKNKGITENQKKKLMAISKQLSIITLNGLNAPIKRQSG